MSPKVFSAVIFVLLLTNIYVLALNIRPVDAIGTIYIKADGSIDPPDAPISTEDNATYTFTSDIFNDSIVIERDNVVVDGAGYTLQGTNASGSTGTDVTGRSNVTIRNTNIEDYESGIALFSSNNNTIYGNNITANSAVGIMLVNSSNYNSIYGNNISEGVYGNGITLDLYSDYNNISGNNITNNDDGITLYDWSDYNLISGNNITANFRGIWLDDGSSYNLISENNITANLYGIWPVYSSGDIISENNITNNRFGIWLEASSDNSIFHNNFVNNSVQAAPYFDSAEIWDDGYPSGGNYWSDYAGQDSYSGPFQNETGSDGRGDKPYVIDANNTDHYPLVNPWSTLPDIAVTLVSTAKTVIGQGYTDSVNVTLENLGNIVEAFNLTVYANSTVIHSEEINLAPTNHTVSFKWNTTGFAYGNYTITAYAWPVTNETNTANNNFTCAIPVHVGVPADISGSTPGVYNRICDMKDIAYLIVHFMGKPGNGKWDPNADVNDDNVINMRDIAIAVHYFNQRE